MAAWTLMNLRRGVLAAAMVVLLVAGCSRLVDGRGVIATPRPGSPVDWAQCDLASSDVRIPAGAECGMLSVPVDYAKPDGAVGLGVIDRHGEHSAFGPGGYANIRRREVALRPVDRRSRPRGRDDTAPVDQSAAARHQQHHHGGREDPASEVHECPCCHEPSSPLLRVAPRGYPVARSSSSRAALKSSAMSHRSGRSSGQEMRPTSSVPLSDITVMLSPEPWKI